MKRICPVLLGLLLLAAPAAKAQFIYTTNGGVITLAQYTGGGDVVVVSNFVNNIGESAFEQAGISSVTIPASVAGIGDYAFAECYNLTNVTISNGVAAIGQEAFFRCASLTNLVIPVSVTSIGGYAFAACSNLAGAAISGGVTNMVNQFNGCANLQRVTIDSGVTSIGAEEFSGFASMTGVTIPGSVESIGDYAFFGCFNLAAVTISNGVAGIGQQAFQGCTNLTGIVIPESVTSIGAAAFAYCSNLAAAAISAGVTNMPNQFYGCANLQSVTIDSGVTTIGADEFIGFARLASLNIPVSVTSIGVSAFAYCPNLTNVTIPGSVTNIGDYAFLGCANLANVTISNGVAGIGVETFFGCASLTNLVIPVSVTSIGVSAFASCSNLASAAISGGVTSMTNQFNGCANLQSVTIDNGVNNIGVGEFISFASLASVTIPGSVADIGDYAFYECSNLANVTISNGVAGIGQQALADCTSLTNLVIPASVTSIGAFAFAFCSNLASAAISAGVTNMANQFFGCTNLQSVTIDDGVTNVGAGEFYGFASMTGVTIPASVAGIGSNAFLLTGLTSVTIPEGVAAIGEEAFYGCSNLIRVTIAGSVTGIANYAFVFCPALKTVLFEGNAPKVGSGVFYKDTKAKIFYWSGATGWSSPFAGLSAYAVTRPAITRQPASFGGLPGTNVTLSVTATGTAPLSYQWQFDAANIPDATNTTLAIHDLQAANSGSYRVVITNDYDETTNSAAAIVLALTNVMAPSIASPPAGQNVVLGNKATLQVAAAGTAPLAYEWLFDNKKLANGSHVSGVTTSNLTLENVTTGNAGSYKVIVSNLYGATSAVASVTVLVPPAITTQPASEHPALGGIATFSVRTSAQGVAYQWLFDSEPLSDNANISGSASNTLRINLVTATNVGSYSVVLSNTAAAVASKVVELALTTETSKPSVAIVFPKTGLRTNALAQMSGTASDEVRVLSVAYWITNVNNGVVTTTNGLAALSDGTGSSSNWTIRTPLMPGTNILAVRSSNYAGLASPIETAQLFYRVTTPFNWVVSPAGMGNLAGAASARGDAAPASGEALYVGEGYTLSNYPAANWWLTNWLTNGIIAGTNATLHFIMESNLIVTANFATNLFAGAAARYDGIFYPSPGPATVTNSGLIYNLQLRTNGGYTGKIYLAGTDYSLNGGFDRSGDAMETIDRTTAEGGNLTLHLNIPWWSDPRQVTGSVKGINSGGWLCTNLTLYAAATNLSNPSNFTALLPRDTNVPVSPRADGYALMTNIAGMIHVGGALSDGASFSSFVEPINDLDAFPVYASLYNGGGLLLGQLSLNAAGNAVPAGSLIWFKPAQSRVLYPNEFTANLEVEGSPWTNSASALAAFTNQALLTTVFSSGSAGLETNMVQLTSTNTLRLLNTLDNTGPDNFSSGTINFANGLMTLTFTNSSGQKITAHGTVLQNSNLGGGFILTATNAATILLEP